MSDQALTLDKPEPLTGAERDLRVTGRVKAAITLMIEKGLRWDEAAIEVKLTTRAMRLSLDKPHVLAYLKAQKQVFLARASSANIHRLTQIRDSSDNMPAVNAIKLLEELGSEQLQRQSVQQLTPGVVIRIVTTAADPPTIDVTPSSSTPDSTT